MMASLGHLGGCATVSPGNVGEGQSVEIDIASKHGEKHYQHVGQDMPHLNQDDAYA